MGATIKQIVKKIVPISVLRLIASYRYGFFGPYENWHAVQKKTVGYEHETILAKVESAVTMVKSGMAVYERDSVIFKKPEYSWFMVSALLYIARRECDKLNVVDFGGSLGSTYFQNRLFLEDLLEVKWNIVEQGNFVESGRKNFSDDHLNFYYSIDESLKHENSTTIIFASSIQYVENPYSILEKLVSEYSFEYIIFDRTTFGESAHDMVVLQKVPPQVYDASYPCWFLSKEKLIEFLSPKYELFVEADALGGEVVQHSVRGEYRGLFFKIKR